MIKNDLNKKLNKLKHVQVYNKIFSMIQEGIYTPGMQLPTEPELAEQLNVSRSTLRKSLALLKEDHLVKNIRGKGNFISQPEDSNTPHQYDIRKHPVKTCLTSEIHEVELECRLEVPSEAILTSLKQETPVVVIADRWYHTEDGPLAYSLSFIPIEVISEYGISLQESSPLLQFLESRVYQETISSHTQSHFSYTISGNFSATKYILSENEQFMLIHENIYKQDRLLVCNKHYLPIEHFELFLTTQ
ncbi:GntR family transcriptional regulator [Streptococcus pluranimalium]|uniref:GntR family transcriptional regulator n=1 Tax=Streptococcus pluranimalium TaxID=82348 RepID=UPI0039EA8F88